MKYILSLLNIHSMYLVCVLGSVHGLEIPINRSTHKIRKFKCPGISNDWIPTYLINKSIDWGRIDWYLFMSPHKQQWIRPGYSHPNSQALPRSHSHNDLYIHSTPRTQNLTTNYIYDSVEWYMSLYGLKMWDTTN